MQQTSADRASSTAFPAHLHYRSVLRRITAEPPHRSYFDGGDLTPYAADSLMDLIRSEARFPHETLDLSLALSGPCSAGLVRYLVARLTALAIPTLVVHIRAEGQPDIVVAERRHRARREPTTD